jgi:hypothetical protein
MPPADHIVLQLEISQKILEVVDMTPKAKLLVHQRTKTKKCFQKLAWPILARLGPAPGLRLGQAQH